MDSNKIMLKVDASALEECIQGLLADLPDAPYQVRMRALDFLDNFSELIIVESGITTGTDLPLLFKPSQRLLDFCAAVRARDFDNIAV